MSIAKSLAVGERVIVAARQHWIAPVRASLPATGLVVLGLLLWIIVPDATGPLGVITTLLALVRWAALVLGGGWIAYNAFAWQRAEYVVTDRRILRSSGMVMRRPTEIPLSSLVDVRVHVGLLGSRLGYGDVRLYLSSGAAPIVIAAITQPADFRDATTTMKTFGDAASGRLSVPRAAGVPGSVAAPGSVAGPGSAGVPGSAAAPRVVVAPSSAPAPGSTPAPSTALWGPMVTPPSPLPTASIPAQAARLDGAPIAPSRDPADLLIRLAELRDRGVISPEDFEAKKREILARM
jgi:hypothetical protein